MFIPVEDSHREHTSFEHVVEVNKPGATLDQMLDWCKAELVGEWRWQLVEVSNARTPGKYLFHFDNHRDTVAFTIKWC